jgi:uncharacterized protein
MYNISKFNVMRKTDSGRYFLVNTRTTAVLDVTDEPLFNLGKRLVSSECIDNNLGEDILNFLIKNGFILPIGFDEINWMKQIHKDTRIGKDAFGLAIALTLSCNFRCTYCYEKHQNISVSDELIDSILNFASHNIHGKRRLRVAWFGGEPLLRLRAIKSLTSGFLKICEPENIVYSARIATNGYLLTPKISELLKCYHVNEIQVTLDGPPDIHDKRRFLVDGRGSFKRILKNVTYAAPLFDRFIIRINIDNQNKYSIKSLLREYLYPIRDKIVLAFAIAMPQESPIQLEPWTIPPSEFWELEKELGLLADQLGFRVLRGYTIPCTTFCMGYQKNSFFVDPFGYVNRCPKFLGMDSEHYGVLRPDGSLIKDTDNFQATWDKWSPFIDDDCKQCDVLPLCMGGCLLYLGTNKAKDATHRCFAKYNLVDSILRDTDFADLTNSTKGHSAFGVTQ